ncbi:MAG TPA: glycosyltransferase [Bacilli bacterium]
MKVLYISPYVPYEGITHAGGYFLYEYLKQISQYVDVDILAPRTDENELASEKVNDWMNIFLVGEKPVRKSLLFRVISTGWNSIINPLGLPRWQLNNLSRTIRNTEILKDVDLVELQFSQTLPLVKEVNRIRPNIPVISFEHDISTQSIHRRAKGTSFSKDKILNILKLFRVSSVERSLLNQCDGVFVFSSKDKTLLQNMGIKTTIGTLAPAIEIPEKAALLTGKPICLFVGAMDRLENTEAVNWFLSFIWPKVLEQIAEAKLKIVGANPPLGMMQKHHPNVTITGFIKDLEPYYQEASLCIAPLLTGAGVKFKVLQAMAYGLPVVTTPIGAEGIAENEPQGMFPYITSDPEQFAAGIVAFLKDESYRKVNGSLLRAWIIENYSFANHTIKRALTMYDSLQKSENKF